MTSGPAVLLSSAPPSPTNLQLAVIMEEFCSSRSRSTGSEYVCLVACVDEAMEIQDVCCCHDAADEQPSVSEKPTIKDSKEAKKEAKREAKAASKEKDK